MAIDLNRPFEPEQDDMSNSTDRRSFPHGRLSAVAAARRSRGVGWGLLAIAGALAPGDEARGQVGVESDREVLEAFYHANGGPDWLFNTNWLSDEPLSEWWGVFTNEQGRVVQLILRRNNLSGPIPPELPRLTHLVYLDLNWNQLSGRIPPELGQMTSLQGLNLFGNQLSGRIPLELGQMTSLQGLHLDDNQLSGPIPPELGRLTNLERLQIHGNRFSGPIPPELGQLTNLIFLSLFSNRLSGPIPPELGHLTGLTSLQLINNQLTGPIPVELGNLTELTLLRIDSDTGLCLPPEMQDTVFGQLALDENVPLCAAVTALPLAASWVLALALVALGLRRHGYSGRLMASP